jgi:hypothetical protein
VKVTEYFEECRRNTDPWNQMPRRMIRNKVMIQAIRVAFGIGGIFDEDEATDIAGTRNVTPKPATITGIIDPFAKTEPTKKAEAKAKPEVVEAEPADEPTLDLTEMPEADWGDKEEGQQP